MVTCEIELPILPLLHLVQVDSFRYTDFEYQANGRTYTVRTEGLERLRTGTYKRATPGTEPS